MQYSGRVKTWTATIKETTTFNVEDHPNDNGVYINSDYFVLALSRMMLWWDEWQHVLRASAITLPHQKVVSTARCSFSQGGSAKCGMKQKRGGSWKTIISLLATPILDNRNPASHWKLKNVKKLNNTWNGFSYEPQLPTVGEVIDILNIQPFIFKWLLDNYIIVYIKTMFNCCNQLNLRLCRNFFLRVGFFTSHVIFKGHCYL